MIKAEIERGEVIRINEYDARTKVYVLIVREKNNNKQFLKHRPKTELEMKVIKYSSLKGIQIGDTLNIRGYLDSDVWGYKLVAQHIKILKSKSKILY